MRRNKEERLAKLKERLAKIDEAERPRMAEMLKRRIERLEKMSK